MSQSVQVVYVVVTNNCAFPLVFFHVQVPLTVVGVAVWWVSVSRLVCKTLLQL